MLLKELEVLNCRKIKQAAIQFHGPGIQVIKGVNGSGKSTIADAIRLTLEGPKAFTHGMITLGETQAEVVAVTDDGIKIKTQISGTTVKQTVSKYDDEANRYVAVSGGVRAFLEGIRSGFEMPWAMRDMSDSRI
ncbi:MAG: AAA family ATPase, partial [Treponema sp.]|nr:AAA family ATPase [Treponema sp.]